MARFITWTMWVFVGLFGLAATAVVIYQLVWAAPEQACLAAHKWWEPHQRVCGTPLYLPAITGKPNKPRP